MKIDRSLTRLNRLDKENMIIRVAHLLLQWHNEKQNFLENEFVCFESLYEFCNTLNAILVTTVCTDCRGKVSTAIY